MRSTMPMASNFMLHMPPFDPDTDIGACDYEYMILTQS